MSTANEPAETNTEGAHFHRSTAFPGRSCRSSSGSASFGLLRSVSVSKDGVNVEQALSNLKECLLWLEFWQRLSSSFSCCFLRSQNQNLDLVRQSRLALAASRRSTIRPIEGKCYRKLSNRTTRKHTLDASSLVEDEAMSEALSLLSSFTICMTGFIGSEGSCEFSESTSAGGGSFFFGVCEYVMR